MLNDPYGPFNTMPESWEVTLEFPGGTPTVLWPNVSLTLMDFGAS